MSDRAYVLINVQPGHTSDVVRALSGIKQIKTIDPCWGKPDIIVVVEVSDQDALTQLVLSRIHEIEGSDWVTGGVVTRVGVENHALRDRPEIDFFASCLCDLAQGVLHALFFP